MKDLIESPSKLFSVVIALTLLLLFFKEVPAVNKELVNQIVAAGIGFISGVAITKAEAQK